MDAQLHLHERYLKKTIGVDHTHGADMDRAAEAGGLEPVLTEAMSVDPKGPLQRSAGSHY
jgi:hypothetical protein